MVDLILDFAAVVYMMGTSVVLLFVGGLGILLIVYLLTRRDVPVLPSVDDRDLLPVTVQLPIYNEPHVINRLLEACTKLDYPEGKLCIQILDDSTDRTTDLVARKVEELRERGFAEILHIHRPNREGFKAGALAYGLRFVTTDCVVIFDADFVPTRDFLRRTMPYFNANRHLALVQTRWGHLNAGYNLLTRAQALNIDAHFAVEQVARSRGRLPMSMNGTGGIWRVSAIKDSGGWSSSTLTEDLDLSYRALMRGWEFLYLIDVAVPGELPPLIQAYKSQQARWATGSTQCLVKHMGPLLTCGRFSPLKRLMGVLHLAQYVIQPVILVLFLLTPVLLWGGILQRLPSLTIVALAGIIPPVVTAMSQFELYTDWRKRLLYLPIQFVAAFAIILSNSRAVIAALWQSELEFVRTPKFRLTRQNRSRRVDGYTVAIDGIIIGELFLAVYALAGLIIALRTAPAAVPYMLCYALSFTMFSGWNIRQMWRINHHRRI